MNRYLFIFSALALIASTFAACAQDRLGNTTMYPVPLQPVDDPPGQIYYNWKNPCSGYNPYLVGVEASMCSSVNPETPLVQLNSLTQVTVSSSYGGRLNVIVYCSNEKAKLIGG